MQCHRSQALRLSLRLSLGSYITRTGLMNVSGRLFQGEVSSSIICQSGISHLVHIWVNRSLFGIGSRLTLSLVCLSLADSTHPIIVCCIIPRVSLRHLTDHECQFPYVVIAAEKSK